MFCICFPKPISSRRVFRIVWSVCIFVYHSYLCPNNRLHRRNGLLSPPYRHFWTARSAIARATPRPTTVGPACHRLESSHSVPQTGPSTAVSSEFVTMASTRCSRRLLVEKCADRDLNPTARRSLTTFALRLACFKSRFRLLSLASLLTTVAQIKDLLTCESQIRRQCADRDLNPGHELGRLRSYH